MSDEESQPEVNPLDLGIKVKLLKDYPVICESLERIGVKNEREKILYPSCYCHRVVDADENEHYAICHFKELFLLQNKPSTFNKTDMLRRATIAYLLQKWNLVEVDDPEEIQSIMQQQIGVVKYSEKSDYTIIHKFKQSKSK